MELTPLDQGDKLPRYVLLFDGVCQLCAASVTFVIRHDPSGRIAFAAIQSDAGQRIVQTECTMMDRDGLLDQQLDSVLWLEQGQLYAKSTAALRVCRQLKRPWPLIYPLFIWIPQGLRDLVYDVVARHRYRIFGKVNACIVPTADIKKRFLT